MGAMVMWIAAALWMALAGSHALTVLAALAQPLLARRRAVPVPGAPVTVIMPMCGMEPELADNLDKLFAQDYPDFAVVFAFARPDDAAMPLAEAARRRRPQVPSSVRVGEAAHLTDPKARNEYKCLAEATTDFIFIVDSNVALAPDALRRCMQQMRPDVGIVTACPLAVRPENFAACAEVASINGFGGRFLLAGAALGFDAVMGKSLLLRWSAEIRDAVFAQFRQVAAEDTAILFGIRSLGLRAVFSAEMVEHPVGARSWRRFWNRQVRWATYRRKYHPLTFFLEIVSSFFPALLVASLGAPAAGLGSAAAVVATIAFWFAMEALLHVGKRWPFDWRMPFAWVAREIALPGIWAQALASEEVVWKERRIAVT